MSSVFIKIVVVLTKVKLAIFLLYKEEGECLRGVGRADLSSG